MSRVCSLSPGQILTGALFNEPMRIETVQANNLASWPPGTYRGEIALVRENQGQALRGAVQRTMTIQ